MPKLKTNRGAAKRFRKTSSGYKHKQANKNHILTKKSTKRKRQLRGLTGVAEADVAVLRQLIPTKAR
ncbi:MAG: 50S ribosomal protein L35 [bacterium]